MSTAPTLALPEWATWRPPESARPWSVRLSEDVMLVDPDRHVLAGLHDDAAMACVLQLTTSWHATVAGAAAEAGLLRGELLTSLWTRHGLKAIATGVHPWSECPTPAPGGVRPRKATEFSGILGRLDPTCGLRIDVAVPSADIAVLALDGLRPHLPLLLALSANSPFWRGRYAGLASTRTLLRSTLPSIGPPRSFGSFRAYVEILDSMMRSRIIPSASAVHWDACLRPDLGAVSVSVMDAQARVDDLAGLIALVQCLVRLHAGGHVAQIPVIPEILNENRLDAARKGMRAELIDPGGHFRQPASAELSMLVDACAPVARVLDCSRELPHVLETAADPGHARQRALASTGGLKGLVATLIDEFAERRLALAGA